MPYFENVNGLYDGQVAVLGLNQAESAATIAGYACDHNLTYPCWSIRDMRVNNLYGILNLPTTIFIDRNGIVREVLIGTINQGGAGGSNRGVDGRVGTGSVKQWGSKSERHLIAGRPTT